MNIIMFLIHVHHSLASSGTLCGALYQIVFLAHRVIGNAVRFSPHRKGGGPIGYAIHHHRDEYRSSAETAQTHIAMIGGHVVIPIPSSYTLNTAEEKKLQFPTPIAQKRFSAGSPEVSGYRESPEEPASHAVASIASIPDSPIARKLMRSVSGLPMK